MIFLITGCAGFIGSHLCERLLKENHIVHGIDNLNNYYDINQKNNNLNILKKFNNFYFYQEDIINSNRINLIPNINVVINLAAMAGVRTSLDKPKMYIRTNIEGQVNLLEQCVKNNIPKFIYASSSSVYGMNKKIPFNENDLISKVNSPYAASKRSGEIMAQLYNQLYGISVIGLRFFTVYGPRGRPDMAPFKFLNSISKGKKFDKYGKGDSYRDYTYIDDIINGIIAVIDCEKKCEIYNLGNSKTVSLNEFINTCEIITNKKAVFNQLPEQKGDVPYTYSDISKAKKDLNYNPNINLKDGLIKMFNWMKLKN